jgi:hypothetical protein
MKTNFGHHKIVILQVTAVLTTLGYTWFKFFGEEGRAPGHRYPDEVLPFFYTMCVLTVYMLHSSRFAAGVVCYTIMIAFMYEDILLKSSPKQRRPCNFHMRTFNHPVPNRENIKDVYIPMGYDKDDKWTFIDQTVCHQMMTRDFVHVVTPDVFSKPGTDFFIPSYGDDVEIASRENVTRHIITPDTDVCARWYEIRDSIGAIGADYLTHRFKDSGKPIQMAIYGHKVGHESVTIRDMIGVANRIRCNLTSPT